MLGWRGGDIATATLCRTANLQPSMTLVVDYLRRSTLAVLCRLGSSLKHKTLTQQVMDMNGNVITRP